MYKLFMITCLLPSSEIGFCKVLMSLPMVSIVTSIMTMVAMSVERYRALIYNRHLKRRTAYKIMVLVWLVALVLAAPQIYEYSVLEEFDIATNETEVVCGSGETSSHFTTIYGSVVVFVVYVIPSAIVMVNYSIVGTFIWRVSKKTTDHASFQGAVSRQKFTVIKMLLLASVVFVLLWAPYFVLFFLAVSFMVNFCQSFSVNIFPCAEQLHLYLDGFTV